MRDISYPPIIVTAKALFRVLGLRFQLDGTEHVPRTGGALLAFNHVSYIDFVLGGLAAHPSKRLVRFMAKREVFDHAVGRPGDALDAPHLGRPCRRRRLDGRGAALPPGRRGGRDLPRGHHLPLLRGQGAQVGRDPDRGRGRRAPHPGGALGHPAADDQGPPARLLAAARPSGSASASRCTPPAKTPSRRPWSCTTACPRCSTKRSTPTRPSEQPPGSWWLPASRGGSAPTPERAARARRRGEGRTRRPQGERAEQVDPASTRTTTPRPVAVG